MRSTREAVDGSLKAQQPVGLACRVIGNLRLVRVKLEALPEPFRTILPGPADELCLRPFHVPFEAVRQLWDSGGLGRPAVLQSVKFGLFLDRKALGRCRRRLRGRGYVRHFRPVLLVSSRLFVARGKKDQQRDERLHRRETDMRHCGSQDGRSSG